MASSHDETVILITGGNGWLGQFVHKELSQLEILGRRTSLHITYHSKPPLTAWIDPSCCHRLDIASVEETRLCLENIRPNIIIHLAALTSPVACERDPSMAASVNSPTHLIDSMKAINKKCLFIFTSTDLVYEGESPPYSALSEQSPLTSYGKTKLSFESHVLQLQFGVVLRLSNMIGPNYCYEQVGCKFLQWLRGALESKEYVGLFSDQMRSFVSVYDVINVTSKIVCAYASQETTSDDAGAIGKYFGIFNVGGPRGCSRLDLARIVSNALGTPFSVHEDKVEGFTRCEGDENWTVFKASNQNSFIAPGILNPRDVTMDSSKTEDHFEFTFSPMENAIPRFLI